MKDKKCLNCLRMTVSQDEYISGMEEELNELREYKISAKVLLAAYEEENQKLKVQLGVKE